MMDQDLGVLYDILDYELQKSKSGDELKESVIALERKYTKHGVNIRTKQKGEGEDFKKKAKVSGEIRKERKSDEGVKKASQRGCLEQFNFRSQSSSLKKKPRRKIFPILRALRK